MKKAFSLLEVLLVIFILSILAFSIKDTFLELFKSYKSDAKTLEAQQGAFNALLQIKRILEGAHLQSIHYDLMPLPNAPKSLKNESLHFFKKPEDFALLSQYALPCLQEFFNTNSLQISNILELDFLNYNILLNQSCKIFQNPPNFVLFKTDSFISPKDFYNPNFKARILQINANRLSAEIPAFLQNPTTAQISPKLYFLDNPQSIEFSDKITLNNGAKEILLEQFSDFYIWQDSFGVWLKICALPNAPCFSAVVTDLER